MFRRLALICVPGALAFALPAVAPTPAQAAPTCPPASISPAEFAQLHVGTTAADTWSVVGAWGEYLPRESTSGVKVFRWSRCTDAGSVDQRIAFKPGPGYSGSSVNYWVIAEFR